MEVFYRVLGFFCLFVSTTTAAVDYYVDSSQGDDLLDGLTSVTAWQTINKVNSSAYMPGDTILFKCGEIWNEHLIVSSSGSSSLPITFSSYGSTCATNKPIIDSSNAINTWTPYSGNIYVADAPLLKEQSNSVINSEFSNNVLSWGVYSTDGLATHIFKSNCNATGGCMHFTSGLGSDNHVNSNLFPVDNLSTYRISFRVSADQEINNVKVIFARLPWRVIALNRAFTATTQWQYFTYDVVADETVSNAGLFFYLPAGQVGIDIDDVSVVRITPEYKATEQLFVDGQYLKLAQEPDSGYFIIDSDSNSGAASNQGASFLTDGILSATISLEDVVGAGVRIRTVPWRVEDRLVTGFDAATNTLSWDAITNYSIKKDFGYYIDNKLWMLNSPGEWFHDINDNKLYIWLPDGSDPNNHLIEVSNYDEGISIVSESHITLDGLAIKKASVYGVRIYNSSNYIASNLTIADSGNSGIYVSSSNNGTIHNNDVKNSVREGLNVKGSTVTSITSNNIENSGVIGSPKNSLAGIHMSSNSDYAAISNNTVINSGYIGIRFLRNTSVLNNVIDGSCLVLDDCGGIYSWNGASKTAPLNSSVVGNMILNSIGNTDGITSAGNAEGIYLDDYSNAVNVEANTVVNANNGIYLHNAYDNIIKNNTLYSNRNYQLYMSESGSYVLPGDLYGNTIKNNTVHPLNLLESISLRGNYNNIDFGIYEGNQYSDIYSRNISTELYKPNYPLDNIFVTTKYSFQEWQAIGNKDLNSTLFSPFAIVPYRIQSVDSSNYITNSAFDTDIASWSSWSNDTVRTDVVSWVADCGYASACLQFKSSLGGTDNHMSGNAFSLQIGKTYKIDFNISADQDIAQVKIFALRGGPTYESVGLREIISVSPSREPHSFLFTADVSLANARIYFYIPAGQVSLFIDDISVQEVTADYNDATDDSIILLNKLGVQQNINCAEYITDSTKCSEYIGLDGGVISWPVMLEPYSSKIIVWLHNPMRDLDKDGLSQLDDNCPTVVNLDQLDSDSDNVGDACDAFPSDPLESLDTDSDGVGNNADTDDDNDGLLDHQEDINANGTVDAGETDPLNADTDGDGYSDNEEVIAGTDPLDVLVFPMAVPDGDLNNDGGVDLADVLIAQRILHGQVTPTSRQIAQGDVAPLISGIPAPDGQFTVGDLLVIQRKVLGLAVF